MTVKEALVVLTQCPADYQLRTSYTSGPITSIDVVETRVKTWKNITEPPTERVEGHVLLFSNGR